MKSPHFRSGPGSGSFWIPALPTFATAFGCLFFKSLLGLKQFLHCLVGRMESFPLFPRGLGSSSGILLQFIPPSLSSAWPWHFHLSEFPSDSLRLQPLVSSLLPEVGSASCSCCGHHLLLTAGIQARRGGSQVIFSKTIIHPTPNVVFQPWPVCNPK